MADERYEWLDADVAERLLRGEPVGSVGDLAGTEARRLEAALREAGALSPVSGELPGEAAALAAFRDASGIGGRDGAGVRGAVLNRPVAGAGADRPGTLRTVRVGATAPARRPRWSSPLRYGLVMSLAGCALGGVAVAAGTGILPEAFGGRQAPAPAASVSIAASPEVPESGSSRSAEPSVSPPATPGTSGSAAPVVPSDAPESGGHEGGDGPAGTTRDPGNDSAVPDGAGDHDGSDGAADGDGRPGEFDGDSRSEVYKKSVQACRDYRADTLDSESRGRLVRLAKGERNLEHFCDRLLEGDGAAGEDGGDAGGDTGQGGGKDPEEGEGGSLPSVSFEMAPGAEAPAGDRAARTDGDDASGSGAEPSVTESATLEPVG